MDYSDARRHLDGAPESLQPRLLRVCALFGALTAVSLLDVGQWSDAGRFWRLAERAARLSGDRAVSSLIGGRRAVYSLYAPGYSAETTLTLADDALGWSGGNSSAGAASAIAARTQVLAMLGERNRARATLTELETTFEGLDDRAHSPALGEWSWSETRLRHTRSFVCSYSGNVREAEAAQDASIALYTTPSALGLAQVRLHQAMSMITSGDPTQGARHVVGVLESLEPSSRYGAVGSMAALTLQALPERAIGHPQGAAGARADGPGAIRVTEGLVVDHLGPGGTSARQRSS